MDQGCRERGKTNTSKSNGFPDSLKCFGQVSFQVHIVTYALYVLIVLSLNVGVTLTKPDSDRFLR